MNLNILYQDEHYIFVEKPPHLIVHPSKMHSRNEPSLLHLLKRQTGEYLYPLHRLDRPVSGIVGMGLSKEATKSLQEIWSTDSVIKTYLTLVRGQYPSPGVLNFPLKNSQGEFSDAITMYAPLRLFKDSSFLKIQISTGRHHQIRRHFARTVNHILGDRKYGKKKYNDAYKEQFNLQRIFLHGHKFQFPHPLTGQNISIESTLPQDLQEVLDNLNPYLINNTHD